MNINTTINLDDILNSNEEASSEETIEILKESIAETAKSIEENAPLPDFDAIVTEWSYRCDKGYPDMKNKSDMIKLQEILNEMGIKSPFKRIEELTAQQRAAKTAKAKAAKAVADTPDVKKYYKGNNSDITSIVTKMLDAKLRDLVYVRMVDKLKTLNKGTVSKINKEMRTYSLKTFQTSGWKTFADFFTVKIERFGAGELMCVMGIKNSRSGGLGEKDLTIDGANGGYYEVKEGPDQIQMAGSGASGKFPYVRKMVQFYQLLDELNLSDKYNDTILKKQLNDLF